MGVFKGSITVRRYLVRGDKPKEQAKLVKGIRAHAIIPIDPKSDVEKIHGWACAEDPDDHDLSSDKIFFGGTLALALRVDSLNPPAAVVKRVVLERGSRRSVASPTAPNKKAMKDEVKKSLRSRYLPQAAQLRSGLAGRFGRRLFLVARQGDQRASDRPVLQVVRPGAGAGTDLGWSPSAAPSRPISCPRPSWSWDFPVCLAAPP